MGVIYSRAEHVLAWLGHPAGFGNLALPFIINLEKTIKHLSDINCQLTAQNIRSASCEDRPSVKSAALREFLRRPWFHRIWVLQEVVNARKISMMFGDLQIDWRIVAGVLKDLISGDCHEIFEGKGYDTARYATGWLNTPSKMRSKNVRGLLIPLSTFSSIS